jgi:hypothetical protein
VLKAKATVVSAFEDTDVVISEEPIQNEKQQKERSLSPPKQSSPVAAQKPLFLKKDKIEQPVSPKSKPSSPLNRSLND